MYKKVSNMLCSKTTHMFQTLRFLGFADDGDGIQTCMGAANILNKLSWTVNKV